MDRSGNKSQRFKRPVVLGAIFITAGLAVIFYLKHSSQPQVSLEGSPLQIQQPKELVQREKCIHLANEIKSSMSEKQLLDVELEFFETIDRLLNPDGESADHHDAFICLNSTRDKLKDSYGFWWRYAMATHFEVIVTANEEVKERLMNSAFESAETALRLNDKSSDAHKWYAVTTGSRGEVLGINERIRTGFTFKEHIDKALEINPNDPELYHFLGRFCYESSRITWFERTLAASLFSNPPSCTAEEALKHFETAERIGKPNQENRLYIAKTFIELSDYKNAALWLKSASNTFGISLRDKIAQKEISTLLPTYKRYL